VTVRELLARIDSAELTEWQAYERVAGPLGGERADVHTAIVACAVANTVSKHRLRPADFLPTWDRAQSWQEQLAVVRALNRRFGGTERRSESGDAG
jgi:hypothetical protein